MPDQTRALQVGVMFRCQHAPERLIPVVEQVESAGFDELWVVEDCFFGGGIASAATALAASRRLRIGLGIMPAVARNPAFAAMEIATLARLYPGRFLPGFGHGMADWMRQIGAFPTSQLAALGEVTQVVRALLRGENVTLRGQHVNLEEVQLVFPPEVVPPISLGVRGPKSLTLAGRVADGTILAEGSSPAYVRWARQHIQAGRRVEGRTEDHRVTVFMPASAHADPQIARAQLRPMLASLTYPGNQQLEPLGILPELAALLDHVGMAGLAETLPEAWFDQLSVSGTPDQCVAALERLAAAGADSVILTLPLEDTTAQIEAFAADVLPRLR